jgi:competence protein ComEA
MARSNSAEHSMNLNQASADDLVRAAQIDDTRAKYLVEYRTKVGRFTSWEEVKNVPSFEEGMIERLRLAGFSLEGTSPEEERAPAERAREPSPAQAAAGGAPEEAGEEEALEEAEEDIADDPEIEAVYAMVKLDHEAALSYETAAELVSDDPVREKLLAFAGDHHRHVRDLTAIIQARGGEMPQLDGDDVNSVFVGFASALGGLGDREALLALTGTEEYTNTTYMTALDLVTDREIRAVLERNFGDEQRHLAWLVEQRDKRQPASEARPAHP